jgi:hypothetical protein
MRYVTTQTGFYTDPDLESWSRDAMWLYRYLYENEHVSGMAGIGRIGIKTMLFESRMSAEAFEAAKAEIGDRVRWYADGTYWVTGRCKHTCFTRNGEVSEKHGIGVRQVVSTQCAELIAAFKERYPMLSNGLPAYPIYTPSRGIRPCQVCRPVAVSVDVPVSVKEPLTSSGTQTTPAAQPQDVIDAWNETAKKSGWCTAHVTKKRTLTINARLHDLAWYDIWRNALAKAAPVPGLRGDNDQGWKANIDWFLRTDTVTKLIEGVYDHWGCSTSLAQGKKDFARA